MPIHIHIEADHATDLIAEIRTLANAFGVTSEPQHGVQEVVKENKEAAKSYTDAQQGSGDEQPRPKKPRKLSKGEHKIEADIMIEAGEKDEEIYPLLSKAQQKRVDKALSEPDHDVKNIDDAPNEETDVKAPEPSSSGLFDDEPAKPAGVTLDDIKKMVAERCNDKDGKEIPEKYALAHKAVRECVPAGQETKIGNVPVAEYPTLYAKIKAI